MTQDNWISVKKELPKEGKHRFSDFVLVATPNFVDRVDRYDFENKKWLMSSNPNISHWQPLPEPPINSNQ